MKLRERDMGTAGTTSETSSRRSSEKEKKIPSNDPPSWEETEPLCHWHYNSTFYCQAGIEECKLENPGACHARRKVPPRSMDMVLHRWVSNELHPKWRSWSIYPVHDRLKHHCYRQLHLLPSPGNFFGDAEHTLVVTIAN